MYQIFRGIVKNPLVIIVCVVLLLVLLYTASSYVSSVMTYFGMETKENIQKKLDNTEAELDKAVEVNKKNEEDRKINEKIDESNKTLEKEKQIQEKSIYNDETKLLEEMNNINSNKPTIESIAYVSESIDRKNIVTPIPSSTRKSNKVSNTQKRKLELLYNRSLTLKGERR